MRCIFNCTYLFITNTNYATVLSQMMCPSLLNGVYYYNGTIDSGLIWHGIYSGICSLRFWISNYVNDCKISRPWGSKSAQTVTLTESCFTEVWCNLHTVSAKTFSLCCALPFAQFLFIPKHLLSSAYMHPKLGSVALIDKEEQVYHPSHPENMANFAPLAPDDRFLWRCRDLQFSDNSVHSLLFCFCSKLMHLQLEENLLWFSTCKLFLEKWRFYQ